MSIYFVTATEQKNGLFHVVSGEGKRDFGIIEQAQIDRIVKATIVEDGIGDFGTTIIITTCLLPHGQDAPG
jgi:hypothetical protein